ncbi:MAG: tRNA (adenosine(37)-N6)-dimethylallyltransferase MiaA [Candidatus Pacebacteria bacterium]|nr:tRNA (adenosine(37)-N6)-dimethylallyltransferase MiaA [Candidatus Paceibacterota bacterium]
MKNKQPVLAIAGPTASGKTALAVNLAHKYQGEIISADSRQVYKGMDVGTGKDLSDYSFKDKAGKQITIPYHLIDVCEPELEFDLAKYLSLANKALEMVSKKHKLPIVAGGSGLYLQALIDNYQINSVGVNKELRKSLEKLSINDLLLKIKDKSIKFASNLNSSEKGNKRRLIRYLEVLESGESLGVKKEHPKFNFLILAVEAEREVIKEKIFKRLKSRLEEENMIEEVRGLHKRGVSWQRLESFGLEYKYISLYLQNQLSYEEMFNKLYVAICRFSKRQMTWLRRWEKQGAKIYWIKNLKEADKKISQFLEAY